jgi:hypothetical protein
MARTEPKICVTTLRNTPTTSCTGAAVPARTAGAAVLHRHRGRQTEAIAAGCAPHSHGKPGGVEPRRRPGRVHAARSGLITAVTGLGACGATAVVASRARTWRRLRHRAVGRRENVRESRRDRDRWRHGESVRVILARYSAARIADFAGGYRGTPQRLIAAADARAWFRGIGLTKAMNCGSPRRSRITEPCMAREVVRTLRRLRNGVLRPAARAAPRNGDTGTLARSASWTASNAAVAITFARARFL